MVRIVRFPLLHLVVTSGVGAKKDGFHDLIQGSINPKFPSLRLYKTPMR
jgi:hypothetical protein